MLIVAFLIPLVALSATSAIELPPTGVLTYLQTNGPTNNIINGDWYTNNANGAAPGYHYVSFTVPCGWPAASPVYVDLFSPEMNSNAPLADEQTGGVYDNTMFELYDAGTTVTSPNIPGPGAAGSLGAQTVYTPVAAAEQWVRFRTLAAPVTCGTYVLRAAVAIDDQNAWRVRIGTDSDADPNNAPPPNYDNPDGAPGTNDEIILGIAQTSYQHNQTVAANQCITLYQFVSFGQATVAFHNFDMDANQRVRYYAPSATLDPIAMTGGVVGTVSGASVWNGGTQTARGPGDVINNPEPGWWRIVSCVGSNNQYIQEGQTGSPTFYSQPPTPRMILGKSDGRGVVLPGDALNYTIAFTNTSNVAPPTPPVPGAAVNVVIRDTIPSNTAYVGCGINAPYTGTCGYAAGVVTFNLTQSVSAGASGSVRVSVNVNANATGSVVNNTSLDYQDPLGNIFPPPTASDTDSIPPTSVIISKGSIPPSGTTVAAGDTITYSVVVTNTSPVAANNVFISDAIPTGTTYVPGSAAPPVASGPSPLLWALGSMAAGASRTVTFAVTVDANPATTSVVNVASVSADSITPQNSNTIIHPFDPTAIDLAAFSATPDAAAVTLRWTTISEQNTWGFHLYRSATAARADAVRITPELILGQGRGTGANYSWRDTDVAAGDEYRYWLQEVALDGTTQEYGPTSASFAAQPALYLPLAAR